MKKPFLTERGTIPALTDCAFRNQCEISAAGNCLQSGTAQGASVINLVTDPSMRSIVDKLPSARRAVQLLDRVIADAMSSGHAPVDGFIEISSVNLIERAKAEDMEANELQFALNGISKEAYAFGSRDSLNRWLDQGQTMAILRGVALKDPDAIAAAETITAVYRIAAFHPAEFSCAAARGFQLVAS